MENTENKNRNAEALADDALDSVAGGFGGQVIASGQFMSQTGTSLNIVVFWSAEADNYGGRTLNVTVAAASSTLYCASIPNSLTLTVNGMTYSATPNAINYGGTSMAGHELGSFSVPYAASPASIQVAWRFNGSIGGVPLGTIYASGMASF